MLSKHSKAWRKTLLWFQARSMHYKRYRGTGIIQSRQRGPYTKSRGRINQWGQTICKRQHQWTTRRNWKITMLSYHHLWACLVNRECLQAFRSSSLPLTRNSLLTFCRIRRPSRTRMIHFLESRLLSEWPGNIMWVSRSKISQGNQMKTLMVSWLMSTMNWEIQILNSWEQPFKTSQRRLRFQILLVASALETSSWTTPQDCNSSK